MLFFRIGEYFEELAVKKSRGQIMDAVDMRPEVVNLIKGDETGVIGAEEAQKGDLLLVRPETEFLWTVRSWKGKAVL